MIKIDFVEPDTREWKAWKSECEMEQTKHNDLIGNKQPSKVKGDIYKGSKHRIKHDVFMNPNAHFYGKCAYCESRMTENQPGDIEHFRPKNAVKDINNQNVMIDRGHGNEPHPGYYWLAYSWQNMLPACRDCNCVTTAKTEQRIGKGNRFPVDKDEYAVEPGTEEAETPLLINPVDEDPENHLEVDITGVMYAKDESVKGQTCIDIFGLNARETLVDGRRRAVKSMQDTAGLALFSILRDYPDARDRLEDFWDTWNGRTPFSSAGRAAIKAKFPPKAISLLLELYTTLKNEAED